jgi:hypothetical protein
VGLAIFLAPSSSKVAAARRVCDALRTLHNRKRILAGGISDFDVPLDENRLCALVMIGLRPDGAKEPLAVEDGFRESRQS